MDLPKLLVLTCSCLACPLVGVGRYGWWRSLMECLCVVSLIVVGSFTLFTVGCGCTVNLVLCLLCGWIFHCVVCGSHRKEHRNAFQSGTNTSNYAKHALEHSHPFGPIHETMQILQYQAKGAHLNTVERYFIYKEFSNNNHLNDNSNIAPNKIFDGLLKLQKP